MNTTRWPMRQLNSLLRSVTNRPLNPRSVSAGVVDPRVAASGTAKPLHIATCVSIIANHHHSAISVVEAREVIQRLAMARWPARAERQLIDDLVGSTGLELSKLAEVTKEWLPW
jgi:hypothetical protein